MIIFNRAEFRSVGYGLAWTICSLAVMSCGQKRQIAESSAASGSWPDSVYISNGDIVVARTFDTLRNSLLSAIQAKGFAYAIEFCNEKVSPLMAVYSDTVKVRRTSFRHRNPDNKPDSLEASILENWDRQVRQGEKPQPGLVRENGKVHYFKPIQTQGMCLNCHGAPVKNIQPATQSAIKNRYPNDLAIDFEEGDLRGGWHLIFEYNR